MSNYIVWLCVPADMSETRDLREIAFDSEVIWTSDGGFEPLGEALVAQLDRARDF